ncbi:MAG: hypothetical protein KTR27_12550 [Leptolyngbyaceae cyanobacterium MAG.088]|nr:hypothetical protein [Leptolyngbyaceae cyanobacterium MAG.088]
MLQRSFEPSSDNIGETIELQQIAYEFRQEVKHRNDFEAYCQWYYAAAANHQAEYAAMQNDIPFFSWFCKRG